MLNVNTVIIEPKTVNQSYIYLYNEILNRNNQVRDLLDVVYIIGCIDLLYKVTVKVTVKIVGRNGVNIVVKTI